jgi:prefoldin subunit 5
MNGAGDACEIGATAGEALVKDGDAVAVGVGTGVEFEDNVGRVIEVLAIELLYVG